MNPKIKTLSVIALVLAAALACTLTAPPAPTAPPASPYGGVWSGQTDQGRPITIVIENDVVVRIEFEAVVRGQGWDATTARQLPASAPVEYNGFALVFQDDGWEIVAAGNFIGDQLRGSLWVEHVHPQGLGTAGVLTTFTAHREGAEV